MLRRLCTQKGDASLVDHHQAYLNGLAYVVGLEITHSDL